MEHFTPAEAPIHKPERLPILPPAKIVGREVELGQTFAQVRVGMPVLLHGPSGVGKTAIAATIAAAFTNFPGGVLWWPAHNDSLEQLIARLGRTYGSTAISDSPTPLNQLEAARQLLKRDNLPLLVLDGTLDLDVVREFVLKVAPGVPVILTNELSAPGPWVPIPVRYLEDDPAIDLFMQAAGLDQVSNVVRTDIRGICRALRGSALAISLAARRVRVTGQKPGEFLGTLTAPGHSGPLLGLNSIFQELPDALQGLLLATGTTFAGRATAALLERLNPSPAETVSHVMGMLAARGIVQPLPVAASSPAYQLHELVHSFAQNWLRQSNRLQTTLPHVVEAVVDFAEAYAADNRDARDHLVAEMPNILATAQFAANHADEDTLWRIIEALAAAFGEQGGYGYELHQLRLLLPSEDAEPSLPPIPQVIERETERPLLAQEAEPDIIGTLGEFVPDAVEAILEDTAPPEVPAPEAPAPEAPAPEAPAPEAPAPLDAAEPDSLAWLDDFVPDDVEEIMAGDLPETFAPPEAAPPPEESAPAAVLDDFVPDVVSDIMDVDVPADNLPGEEFAAPAPDAPLVLDAGDEAEDILDLEALAAASARGTTPADLLKESAQELLDEGRMDEAGAAFEKAVQLYEETGNTEGMFQALERVASISLEQGKLENAVVFATRAENLAAQANDFQWRGRLLLLLGDIRTRLTAFDDAAQTYANAVEAFRAANDTMGLALAHAKLGNAQMDLGDFGQAAAMLNEAARLFGELDEPEYLVRVVGNLGTAYGQMGQWNDAEACHEDALNIARPLGDIDEQERQLDNLIHIASRRRDRPALLSRYLQAVVLAFSAGEPGWQAKYMDGLGRLLMDDLSQIGVAVSLMAAAHQIDPGDDERERLLGRAQKRLERASAAQAIPTLHPDEIDDWARGQLAMLEAGA